MDEFLLPIMIASAILSILLSIMGVGLKKPVLLAAAGMTGVPFAFYMGIGFDRPTLIFSLFQIIAAFAVKRQKMLFAWLMIVPMMILLWIFIAYVVLI